MLDFIQSHLKYNINMFILLLLIRYRLLFEVPVDLKSKITIDSYLILEEEYSIFYVFGFIRGHFFEILKFFFRDLKSASSIDNMNLYSYYIALQFPKKFKNQIFKLYGMAI